MTDWEPPRCQHRKILGSCDFDTCPEERGWWQTQWANWELHLAQMAAALPAPPNADYAGGEA